MDHVIRKPVTLPRFLYCSCDNARNEVTNLLTIKPVMLSWLARCRYGRDPQGGKLALVPGSQTKAEYE